MKEIITPDELNDLSDQWKELVSEIPGKTSTMPDGVPFLILSGASGSGKDSVQRHLDFTSVFSHIRVVTTRPPRPGEEDRDDKICMTLDEFAGKEDSGEFLVTTEIQGHQQGVLKSELARFPSDVPLYIEANALLAKKILETQEAFNQLGGRAWCGVFLYVEKFKTLLDRMLKRNEELRQFIASGQAGYVFPDREIRTRLFSAPTEIRTALDIDLYRVFANNRDNQVDKTVAEIKNHFQL